MESHRQDARRYRIAGRLFLSLAALALSAQAAAQLPPTSAGFPDPTYGNGGAQVFDVKTGYESVNAIVPTPDGHWLISGSAESAGNANDGVRFLARLQPDGRFDPSFGTNGFVTDNFYNAVIAVQASGKILATGASFNAGLVSGVLVRLLPNGTRDFAFGTANGRTVLDTVVAATPNQDFESLDIDGQGRIIGTARMFASNSSSSRVEVWRFSADGIPDPLFGLNGHVLLDDLPQVAYNSIVRVQPDGKLVVATWCQTSQGTATNVCVVRLHANGSRDGTFGPNGVRKIVPPGNSWYPIYSLTIAPDGKIYISGTEFFSSPTTAVVFRLNSDGTPDMGYGQAGIAKLVFTGETAYAMSVHLLPDGKQIVVGAVNTFSGQPNFGYVARLTANGQLDATFGTGGISPKVMAGNHWFNKGAVLADGAVLAIGRVMGSSEDDVSSLLARIVGVETTTNVIEFYNTILDHYFVTADPVEAASIDAGVSGPGWGRTGKTWKSGGPSRVCRLYGSPEIDPATGLRRGPNSHVYSIEAAECLAIRADPGWRFESYDFSGWLRLAPTCPAGTIAVYRVYNNRFAFNDSNHRYTIELAIYNQMIALGWTGEGIVFCAVL